MAPDIAATTRAATGSHSADQIGSVLSIQSRRVHDSTVCTPEGKSVASSDALRAAIDARQPGERVSLTYTRSGTSQTVQLTLATRPS